MKALTLVSSVLVAASPDTVWQVLTDAASWPSWCQQISHVEVVPDVWEPGVRLAYSLQMLDLPAPIGQVGFDVTVESVEPEHQLVWASSKWWGVSARRSFNIQAVGVGECRVVDQKEFSSPWWPVAYCYPRRLVTRMSTRWLDDLARVAAHRQA